MAIEKLTEFAKTGQKDTDQLDLEVGFIVNRKPARQWFNWLFNTLTTKINEIIDADFMPKSDVVDNLTTDDAKKPVSAKQAKLLQDNKLDENKRGAVSGVASLDENKKVPVIELPSATSSAAGVMKLINDLITGGTDAALTAEAGKIFLNMFAGGYGHFRIPNPAQLEKPWIVQFGSGVVNTTANTNVTKRINYNITFPNGVVGLLGVPNNSLANVFITVSAESRSNAYFDMVVSCGLSLSSQGYTWIAIGN